MKNAITMKSRRDFIKTGCIACMGLTGMASLLEACSAPLQVVKLTNPSGSNLLTVPLSKFTDPIKMVLVRSAAVDDDILLVKNGESYRALLMMCTHEGVALTATDSKIYCNAHGSQFDFAGNVTKEPALKPLKQFKTEVINNSINIYLNQKI
ncbi:Rieske (2Fe-2S) protein [Pedobacter nutrimenti]|uniref:QcrA and Rieske domain-containing protein n=1 Tax=Pedobacter nutrimenti TaxID=1241337 RepID=UPI002930BC5A|nr:Rieske (2Fe-2S) protein [Pedobacter nutrimenti]